MVEGITLRKVKNLEELVLDMLSTPDYILKSVDWGTVKGTHHSYKYVNQVGESITNTSLGTRPITIEGWVIAKDSKSMSLLKRRLNSFVNPQDSIDILYKDYTIRCVPDETVKYSIDPKENNDIICKFQISATCPNPLFSDVFETSSAFVMTEASFHFPFTPSTSLPEKGIVFGKRTASLLTNVINKGSVSVGMRIVFKANGTVVNPSLINVDTQEEFLINKTMTSGEEIEVNTNIGEKGVRGRVGNDDFTNYYMYKDIDSPWIQLDVGDNIFRYNAESGSDKLDVFVYFQNRYLEVQECD